jgi:hypothetical protein
MPIIGDAARFGKGAAKLRDKQTKARQTLIDNEDKIAAKHGLENMKVSSEELVDGMIDDLRKIRAGKHKKFTDEKEFLDWTLGHYDGRSRKRLRQALLDATPADAVDELASKRGAKAAGTDEYGLSEKDWEEIREVDFEELRKDEIADFIAEPFSREELAIANRLDVYQRSASIQQYQQRLRELAHTDDELFRKLYYKKRLPPEIADAILEEIE